jgi:hypothetical protein
VGVTLSSTTKYGTLSPLCLLPQLKGLVQVPVGYDFANDHVNLMFNNVSIASFAVGKRKGKEVNGFVFGEVQVRCPSQGECERLSAMVQCLCVC